MRRNMGEAAGRMGMQEHSTEGGHPPDYRSSHLSKGEVYDGELSRGDFDTYMTGQEQHLLARVVPLLFPGGVPRYLRDRPDHASS
jgi:hypothetical protein